MASKKRTRAPSAVRKKTMVIPDTTVEMDVYLGDEDKAPNITPYIFDQSLCTDVATGVRLGLNIALTGPTGCGKTSLITSLAAQLGQPYVRFNMDGETRVSNLRGMNRPSTEDGALTLKFSPGDLVIAMQLGYWVMFDEIDAAAPPVLFVLQPVLEEGSRRIHVPETGEVVEAHPNFRVFATGNTIGYRAQARAHHAGTNMLNDAFVDRFGMVIACDYPTKEDEMKRIKAHCPAADDMIVDGIARCAEELRQDDKFRSDFSTRRCIQWARLASEYMGVRDDAILHTAELSVVRKMATTTDAAVTRETIRRIFGYAEEDGRA
jgi:cobaltochelatase CobS